MNKIRILLAERTGYFIVTVSFVVVCGVLVVACSHSKLRRNDAVLKSACSEYTLLPLDEPNESIPEPPPRPDNVLKEPISKSTFWEQPAMCISQMLESSCYRWPGDSWVETRLKDNTKFYFAIHFTLDLNEDDGNIFYNESAIICETIKYIITMIPDRKHVPAIDDWVFWDGLRDTISTKFKNGKSLHLGIQAYAEKPAAY